MKDRTLFENLVRIRNAPDMAAFKQWLNTQHEESRDRLSNLPDEANFRKEQGVAQTYAKILAMIEDSPKLLEKLS